MKLKLTSTYKILT